MPGRLDQQPSGVAVAGVGDPALAGSAAAGLLAGHQAQPGPTVAPVKRASRRSPPPAEAGQHCDPPRQPGRATTGAQAGVGPTHRCASRRSRRASTAIGLSNGDPGQAGPPLARRWPATGVRLVQAAADQTSPGPAAASTAAAGPPAERHGRLGGLGPELQPPPLGLGRHPHPREPPKVGQPRQPLGIAPVGLDPTPGRAFQLGRRHHHPAHPGRLECPGQPEPGRASLSATPTGLGSDPTQLTTASVAAGNRRDHTCPAALSSTPARIDRAATSRPTDRRPPTIPAPPVLAARPPQRRQPTPPSQPGAGPQTV